MTLVLLALVLAAAFANGANDVSKGVGTLVGSGIATYRRALVWGTVWTVAGAITAILLSAGLVNTFSTGLLRNVPDSPNHFFLAIATGVFAWVIVASRTGLPVSTTHAMTGAIIGAGLMMNGGGAIRWTALGMTVLAPLALGPIVAGAIAYVVHRVSASRLSAISRYCVCIEEASPELVPVTALGTAMKPDVTPRQVMVGGAATCDESVVVSRAAFTDMLHWGTAAALSFARGLNDNPKIVALAIGAAAAAGIGGVTVFLCVAAAMGLGSYIYGGRVTQTLAEKVTRIDPIEGLSASSVASTLVLLASFVALPVSTTHVATGAIIGVGLREGIGAVQWKMVRDVVLAWIVTLPAAALVAAMTLAALLPS
jgi:inorganic phosphate transporter, PiT family